MIWQKRNLIIWIVLVAAIEAGFLPRVPHDPLSLALIGLANPLLLILYPWIFLGVGDYYHHRHDEW